MAGEGTDVIVRARPSASQAFVSEPAAAANADKSHASNGRGGDAGVLMRSDRTRSQAAASQWQSLRKELSVGLELECFLPDLGALTSDTLAPTETKAGLFHLVAERLTAMLRKATGRSCERTACASSADDAEDPSLPRCRANWRRVSADQRDWGSLWTVTDDGSIKPEMSTGGNNPFPVELVSKLMRFNDVDVTLFCDMVHTLSSPPISGKANESTGLHVHIGKYPQFFTVWEVVRIIKAYIRYEPVINRLLPLSRRKNVFCEDLRSVLAKLGGLGESATEEDLMRLVDAAMEKVTGMSRDELNSVSKGVQGATTRGQLVPALAREGLVWSCCDQRMMLRVSGTDGAAAERWVAPGMVLRELWRNSGSGGRDVLWKAPSSQDLVALFAADRDEPTGPDAALNDLGDDDEVICDFTPPPEVDARSFQLWLLRGALGFVGRQKDRYCKLNLMRIHLPSHKATLEFRQFPGGNFDQALTIWGWVQFLGLFISQSIATPVPLPCPNGPPADEQELLTFMQLSSDTLLLTWYRDTLIQQPSAETVIQRTRARWLESCVAWRSAAKLLDDEDGPPLLDACVRWRRMFWAMAGTQNVLAPDDEVWAEFEADKALRVRFLQRMFVALVRRLTAYVEHLRAMEEVSRCTSLPTVVAVAVDAGRVRQAREEIRLLQASVTDTGGWRQCDPSRLRLIGEQGNLAVRLLLDHARNLLELCERTAMVIDSETSAESQPAPTSWALAIGGEVAQAVEERRATKRPASTALVAGGADPGVLAGRSVQHGPPCDPRPLLQRLYKELCELLAPRVDEIQDLWRGLRERGWDAARVAALNVSLARLGMAPSTNGQAFG